jgi:hypothetical protein
MAARMADSRELGAIQEQVADDLVVGELEDGRLGILVDGHDGPRGLHARPVRTERLGWTRQEHLTTFDHFVHADPAHSHLQQR